MFAKLYWAVWILFALIVGVIYLAGAFDLTIAVVGGFVSFGLVFAGMMCVLPHVVSHPSAREEIPTKARVMAESTESSAAEPQGWISRGTVDLHQPGYH